MRNDRDGGLGRPVRWVFVFALLSAAAATEGSAAPLRRHGPPPDPSELRALEDYLVKGPPYWISHAPPPTPARISIVTPSGGLKQNLFVDYLQWRWQRHPARFDQDHPRIAAVLTAAAAGSTDPGAAAAALAVPPARDVKADAVIKRASAHQAARRLIHPEAQVLDGAASVPEPSSWLIAGALAGLAAWRRCPRPRAGAA
jgi:hypothetical protein